MTRRKFLSSLIAPLLGPFAARRGAMVPLDALAKIHRCRIVVPLEFGTVDREALKRLAQRIAGSVGTGQTLASELMRMSKGALS
jgi:hypothetical protein